MLTHSFREIKKDKRGGVVDYHTSIDFQMNTRFSERDKFLYLRANAETKKKVIKRSDMALS